MKETHNSNERLIKAAAKYMIDRNSEFVFPGKVSEESDGSLLVKFLVPDALNPNCV